VGQFLGAMSTNNVQVSGMVPRWNCGDRDEEHGVGPRDGSHTLCQVMDLGDVGLLPQGTIRAFAEFSIFSRCACVQVEGIAMVGSVPQVNRWEWGLCGMESMETRTAAWSTFCMGFGWAHDSVG